MPFFPCNREKITIFRGLASRIAIFRVGRSKDHMLHKSVCLWPPGKSKATEFREVPSGAFPVRAGLENRRTALTRTVSEYCSARVSHVGLSTKKKTEPYSDNPLNRTRNPSEPYSDKETPLRRALRRFAVLVGLSTGNPPKIVKNGLLQKSKGNFSHRVPK